MSYPILSAESLNTRLSHLAPNERAGLTVLVARLYESYGGDLQCVVLFGSKARNESHSQSDIDLLVVIDTSEDDYWQHWNRIVDIVWEIELEFNFVTSLLIKNKDDYEAMRQHRSLLARNIDQDGVNLWTNPQSAPKSTPT